MITSLYKNIDRLILASASPRRKDLLQNIGLVFDIIEAGVEEKILPGESPREFVLRAARDKAGAVSRAEPESWVMAADTVVVLGNRIIGKPVDAGEALEILQSLSGKRHVVHTGFCLRREKGDVSVNRVVTTEVFFSSYSRDVAAAYVSTGEPLDKAGAYGIQERGGALVERISGSYSNVVGLPVVEVVEELLRYGVIAPRQDGL